MFDVLKSGLMDQFVNGMIQIVLVFASGFLVFMVRKLHTWSQTQDNAIIKMAGELAYQEITSNVSGANAGDQMRLAIEAVKKRLSAANILQRVSDDQIIQAIQEAWHQNSDQYQIFNSVFGSDGKQGQFNVPVSDVITPGVISPAPVSPVTVNVHTAPAPVTPVDVPVTHVDAPVAPVTPVDAPVAPVAPVDTPVAPVAPVDAPVDQVAPAVDPTQPPAQS